MINIENLIITYKAIRGYYTDKQSDIVYRTVKSAINKFDVWFIVLLFPIMLPVLICSFISELKSKEVIVYWFDKEDIITNCSETRTIKNVDILKFDFIDDANENEIKQHKRNAIEIAIMTLICLLVWISFICVIVL